MKQLHWYSELTSLSKCYEGNGQVILLFNLLNWKQTLQF